MKELNKFISNPYGIFVFLIVLLIPFYVFSLQFEIYEGGADNYIHYRISRYAFTYPELFLDHWGKPIFTLFSAPFAQFGFNGLMFFNLLCGFLASYFAYKISQIIELKESWITIALTLFMPIYFIVMISAMTEVLFSFLIIYAIYLFLKEKYILSAIIFSLLFLVRTEAYILYPVIILVFIYKKQWKAIPFIATGFLIYSIIGFFYFGDFFWLINQNPYSDTSQLYGKGELFYFVKNYKLISGVPISVLIFVGVIIAFAQTIFLFYKKKLIKIDFLLIETLFILYFIAHSYVWWTGTGASAGLLRVMAAIVPLMAISATRGVDFFIRLIPVSKVYGKISLAILSVYLFTIPFSTYPIPFKYNEREKTIVASVHWYQNSEYKNTKVYFYEPLVYFLLDRNPFDHTVIKELIDDREHPEKSVQIGEIVFYDTQFGPNEGKLPIEKLMNNPYFILINYFEPENEISVYGGHTYAMFLFKRVEKHESNNLVLLEKIIQEKKK